METSTARAVNDPAADFYIGTLRKLQDTGIPFLVGGAFAYSHYSHVPRDTKDIDVFVKPDDCPRVLEAFERLDLFGAPAIHGSPSSPMECPQE